MCYWCGGPEETLVHNERVTELQCQFQIVTTICFMCLSEGKQPYTSHPNNMAKRHRVTWQLIATSWHWLSYWIVIHEYLFLLHKSSFFFPLNFTQTPLFYFLWNWFYSWVLCLLCSIVLVPSSQVFAIRSLHKLKLLFSVNFCETVLFRLPFVV